MRQVIRHRPSPRRRGTHRSCGSRMAGSARRTTTRCRRCGRTAHPCLLQFEGGGSRGPAAVQAAVVAARADVVRGLGAAAAAPRTASVRAAAAMSDRAAPNQAASRIATGNSRSASRTNGTGRRSPRSCGRCATSPAQCGPSSGGMTVRGRRRRPSGRRSGRRGRAPPRSAAARCTWPCGRSARAPRP